MMAQERLTIISADCHAGPAKMSDYRPYLDLEFRADFDDYCAEVDAFDAKFGGYTGGGAISSGEQGLWDAKIRTGCLDEDGVAAEVIFAQGSVPFAVYPAVGGHHQAVGASASPAQIAAGCRAYNRWLADLCSHDPRRHLGIARVPLPDVARAIEEAELATKLGLRGGVHLPPLLSNEAMPFFNDPVYEPFWAACEANQMVLNMHGGANLSYGPGAENVALVFAEVDWLSHRGLSHLIFAGVFERHPQLHVALTEQRTHWLHQLLDEFDSIQVHSTKLGRNTLPRKPSDYFRSNCFVGASFLCRPECEARGDIGSRCFMWGSDYPHNEGTWPYTDQALRYTFGWGVPREDIEAMLAGNAARCYYLDLDELGPLANRIGPTEADLRVPIDVLPGESPGDPTVRSWAFRRHGAWH
jgi:predicted TIM-barrel fold metal-dependent hydrolase